MLSSNETSGDDRFKLEQQGTLIWARSSVTPAGVVLPIVASL